MQQREGQAKAQEHMPPECGFTPGRSWNGLFPKKEETWLAIPKGSGVEHSEQPDSSNTPMVCGGLSTPLTREQPHHPRF